MAQKLTVVVVLMVMCGIGGFALAAESEDPGSGPPASHRSNHALLSSLDEAQRANAVIEFELPGGCDLATRLQADQVSSLWNEGRTAEALVALDRLEATGASLVVGIAWKVAVPADAPEIYNDVPIGNGRTGYEDAALGSSGASGNIFVLVQWTDGWSMNISTNPEIWSKPTIPAASTTAKSITKKTIKRPTKRETPPFSPNSPPMPSLAGTLSKPIPESRVVARLATKSEM